MLTIEYKLTEEEYLAYNFYTAWLIPERRVLRIRYYIIYLLFFFVIELGVFYIFDNNQIKNSSIVIISILSIAFFFTIPYSVKSSFNSKARKLLKKSGPDTIISAIELTFNENGIFGKSKVAEVKYLWTAFKKKVIKNNCYYLYTNILQAVVIPIRAFRNQEEKEKFEALLAKYLPLEAELPFNAHT